MLAHAIAEIRVWEFFLDPDLIAANDRPQTAANDGFYGDPATFVYENTVGKLFWTRYYQYAEDGNRLLANSTTGDDPEGPYSHEYDHDAHGNMISMPHLSSMIWNHDDEMQEVAVGSETVYFQYAGGNRTRKFVEKSGTTTEERIYLGAFEIFRKRISGDIDVERESLHISDGTGRILLIETLTIDEGDPVTTPVGMWRYQLSNHIGSASTEINEDGDIISHEEYHPYGTSAYRAVDSSIDVSARRYRYSGMERDDETGLGYHTARYYASWLGRWTASDPIGLAGGGNRFAYPPPSTENDQNGMAPPSYASNVVEAVEKRSEAPTEPISSTGESFYETDASQVESVTVRATDDELLVWVSTDTVTGWVPTSDPTGRRAVESAGRSVEFDGFWTVTAPVEVSVGGGETGASDGEHYRMDDLNHAMVERRSGEVVGWLSTEEYGLKRATYAAHGRWSATQGEFDPGISPEEGMTVGKGGQFLEPAAAEAANDMLATARSELIGKDGVAEIYVSSGARTADQQFEAWDTGWHTYFELYKAQKLKNPEASASEVDPEDLAKFMRAQRAFPGFSDHQPGLAIDIKAGDGESRARLVSEGDSVHKWLTENAPKFGFQPIKSEAWHWEFKGR